MSEINIKGIGIVIDDKIFDKESEDSIHTIVDNLEELGIPLVKFDRIPPKKFYESFSEVSFVLLDWKLLMMENPSQAQKERQYDKNIEFIKSLKNITFAPVFIFSSEAKEDITDKLVPEGIFNEEADYKNHILVETKTDLVDTDTLKEKIQNWFEEHPSVYILKSWEESNRKAKNEAFWELYNSSPSWPKVLWESYERDKVDEKAGIHSIVNKLILSRAFPLEIDKEKIDISGEVEPDELKNVLIGTMYLNKDKIRDPNFVPGDIFKKENEDVYYLNIRPSCDTVVNRSGFDKKLYLVRGEPIDLEELKNYGRYDEKYGLIERNTEVILYGLNNHNFVKFNFNVLKVEKTDTLIKNRITRLIPPYINNVTQKYSSYLGRIGLPRLPDDIFN
ncbi:MAG: hypothetical protein WD357_09555 [Gracilimonas sp.]